MFNLALERRPLPSRWLIGLSPLIAVALMLLTVLATTPLIEQKVLVVLHVFFIDPIDDLYGLGELAIKAAPLMLIALGLSIGFRSNVWNIGAEGQLTLGAISGTGVALWFYGSDSAWLLPAMFICGMLGGMAWAALPALLRTRYNTNEILVSLMLNYVALLLLSYLVHGPWRDPEGFNFPESRLFTEASTLPILIDGTRLHAGCVLALVAAVIAWFFIRKTFLAFQMQVAGLSESAARYAGFSRSRMIWIGLLCGGAAAGVAGISEVSGPLGQLLPLISPGYGYAAIIVAFVGRLHPLGIALVSVLMSLLYLGGEAAQIKLGLPSAITGVFQGVLLFYMLTTDLFIQYRVRWMPLSAPVAAG